MGSQVGAETGAAAAIKMIRSVMIKGIEALTLECFLAARLPRLKNFNVAVREWHEQIVFLRKIVEGGTDKSYGIQVARLAGVPKGVLERAKEILGNLEEYELTPEGNVRQSARRQRDRDKLKQLTPPPQMDLFG